MLTCEKNETWKYLFLCAIIVRLHFMGVALRVMFVEFQLLVYILENICKKIFLNIQKMEFFQVIKSFG